MIKAVFLDFFNTIACYEPSRENVYIETCKQLGIHVEEKTLTKSLLTGDLFWRDENRRNPIDSRSDEEKLGFWSEYIIKIINGTGNEISKNTALQIFSQLRHIKFEFKAFPDVIATLKQLKDSGLTVGLISNAGQEMQKTYEKMGLQPYLDNYTTSFEVGADKPNPEIFLAALRKSQVQPEEAIFVGDQYDIDIMGARGVGMKAILIDRKNFFSDISDCTRIQNLNDILKHI